LTRIPLNVVAYAQFALDGARRLKVMDHKIRYLVPTS